MSKEVLTEETVKVLRGLTEAMFDHPTKVEGVETVLDLCDSHEELRRRLDVAETDHDALVNKLVDAKSLLDSILECAQEALSPDECSAVTCIRRGRGHTEEEDWNDALSEICGMIDRANDDKE